MNDHELDRVVASATHVRDSWVDSFDLRAAEDELMEAIMATDRTYATVPLSRPTGPPGKSAVSGGRRRRFRLAVGIGAAAALLVGMLVARSVTDDSDRSKSDIRPANDQTITPMIAASIPEGFEPTEIFPEEGLDPNPPPDGPINTWIYGDLTATALTNDVVITVQQQEQEGTPVGEPVTVRGKPGILCSPGPQYCDFGNNITAVGWTERPDLHVSVESRTFDQTQILAIAEAVVVDGTKVQLGDVPDGMTKPAKVGELNNDWVWAYSVLYRAADSGSFALSTRAQDEATRIYNLWLSGPRDDTEVQGHDASFEDIDGSYVLTWEASRGQLVEVLTNGVDETMARDFAENVRSASDKEWTDLQELVAKRPPAEETFREPPPPENAVHRELAGGTAEAWGWRTDDGGLCYQTNRGEDRFCDSQPPDVLGVSPMTIDDVRVWDFSVAVGVAPDGTESIDGGETTFGEQVEGGQLFIWEGSSGEMPDSLTFRDANGNEIATTVIVTY